MREIDRQIEQFLTHCSMKQLSKKTLKAYNQTLYLMANYLEQVHSITSAEQVKAFHISAYIGYLQERGKYTVACSCNHTQQNYPERRTDYKRSISKTTINNYIRNMRVFFNFLVEFDYIERSPMRKIKQLKNARHSVDFITDSQFESIIGSLDMAKFHEYRDKVIIELLLDSGMRIGECIAIQMSDIDRLKNCLVLPWENTNGKKTRTVFFSNEVRKSLRLWIRHKDSFIESEYLFPSTHNRALSVNGFESNMRVYGNRAGVPNVSPKVFRNNFAKRFLLNGGDIFTLSKILGHSSVAITEAAYLDLTDDDLREQYQRFSPVANMRVRQ